MICQRFIVLLLLVGLTLLNCTVQKEQSSGYYDEPWRPGFHFSPEAHWMNDPNGLVYYNGKYHLFYQYYPDSTVWGPMHWGHAESTDLLHWQHLPIALYPDSLGWIFSGSAVIDQNNTAGFGPNAMVAIFTYHNDEIWKAGRKNTESQGIAYSLDEGKTWMKYKGNPVLNNSGEQDFRDPKVFWNKLLGRWTLTLAAGDRIKIYSSADLKSWQLDSEFIPPVKEGYGVWECPDLFPLKAGDEEKWVMILSQNKNGPNGGSATRYFIGNFDGKTFTPITSSQWFDYGMDFYAAVTFGNVPDGKRILQGWMSNWEYATKTPTTVWRSAMNLPRELQLVKEGESYTLRQAIPAQFQSLTSPLFTAKEAGDLPKSGLPLSSSLIEFDVPDTTNSFDLSLSNSSGEMLSIVWKDNQLQIDRSKSGKVDFSPEFARQVQVMPLDRPVRRLQLVVDQSSVEVVVNDGVRWMTCQVFPTQPYETLNINSSKPSGIRNLKVWKVQPTWVK